MPHHHPILPILVIGAGQTGLSLAITRSPRGAAAWRCLEGTQAIEPFLTEGQRLRALCFGNGRCVSMRGATPGIGHASAIA